MTRRIFGSVALSCVMVAIGWLVVLGHGIGSCGPASDTPVVCVVVALGPIWLWLHLLPWIESTQHEF